MQFAYGYNIMDAICKTLGRCENVSVRLCLVQIHLLGKSVVHMTNCGASGAIRRDLEMPRARRACIERRGAEIATMLPKIDQSAHRKKSKMAYYVLQIAGTYMDPQASGLNCQSLQRQR